MTGPILRFRALYKPICDRYFLVFMPSLSSSQPQPGPSALTPCLYLGTETLQVTEARGARARASEREAAVIGLVFDYDGTRVRCSDPGARLFRSLAGGMACIERDRQEEERARYLLESFGAVQLAGLEDRTAPPGSLADYLVQPDGDVHGLCSFSAYVLPQLRALGWRIEVAPDYPYQVVEDAAPWYAEVEPDERADWFSFELGVEVAGERISMLPVLLDLIERASELDGLTRLTESDGPRRRCVALPVQPGQYIAIPPERVRGLVRVLLELYRGERDATNIRFPTVAAAALTHLDHELGGEMRWSGGEDIRRRGRILASDHPEPAPPPAGLQATLRPYQERGLAWLQTLRAHDIGGILADDMGLGKTLQTIAHLLVEKEAGRMDRPALVVAPTSLLGNWKREMARFAPSLQVVLMRGKQRHARWHRVRRADVVVTSYPLVVRDRERWAEFDLHLLILDEAQTIKNTRSQARRAVASLSARHRLCLTGTPMENHLGELWSLMDFLVPGLLGSREQFRGLFRTPIEKRGDQARLEALRERVSPYILRRLKEDVAPELPGKTELVRPVELAGRQRDLYESIRMAAHEKVRHAIRERGFSGSAIAVLDALMKLRQVCCDPRLLDVPSARAVASSAKYQSLFDLLATQLSQKRRVLIFSQFTSMLALIAQGLEERRIGYVTLTGSTGDRQKPVDSFERRLVDVFLISLKAGGTGLNLTSADTVIHYDPWWNPAAQAQATDRAYRIGQKRPVFVYNLIVAGSVEERMMALQKHKRQLADTLLGQAGSRLSERDVEDLLAPLSSS